MAQRLSHSRLHASTTYQNNSGAPTLHCAPPSNLSSPVPQSQMSSPRSSPPHPASYSNGHYDPSYLNQTHSPTLSSGGFHIDPDHPFSANYAGSFSPFSSASTVLGQDEIKPNFNLHPSQTPPSSEVEHLKATIHRLQRELQRSNSQLCAAGGPVRTPPGWQQRAEARKKLFCSHNRAGNALCAWHDSRRERRLYPPRNAPDGYLNCGCTTEEALFEESLARNGVGSYRPSGDHVRMDPALRRPLLELLQRRYGYRDGDFEIDTTTGNWKANEDALSWEQKLKTKK